MKKIKTLVIAALGLSLVACGNTGIKIKEDIKDNEVRIEYTGKDIKVHLSDFIDNMEELNLDGLLTETEVHANTTIYTDGEEENETSILTINKDEDPYFTAKDLGTYEVLTNYNKTEIKVTVIVEDTTAPAFENESDVIKINQGDNKENVLKQIKTSDLLEVKVDFKEKIDYDTAGEYKIKVSAVDLANNKTTKQFTVKVSKVDKDEDSSEETQVSQSESTVSQEVPMITNTAPQSNTGNSSYVPPVNNDTSTSTETPQAEEPTPPVACVPEWKNLGNSGMIFYSWAEADNYARTQSYDRNSSWYGYGWWVFERGEKCGIEGWTVDFYE